MDRRRVRRLRHRCCYRRRTPASCLEERPRRYNAFVVADSIQCPNETVHNDNLSGDDDTGMLVGPYDGLD